MLPPKFEEPAGFQWGSFSNAQGANIRYGSLQPAGEPKGTMVIVAGFGEPIEKYFEVIRDMADRGFAVWMMDWRGQGGSDRYLADAPQKMFSQGYDEHIETLHHFAGQIVKKSPGPMVLTAHSMGAHIGLRCLKEHDGLFDAAIVTAPMISIDTGVLAKPVARQIARFAKAGNYLEKYVPGGGDWNEAHMAFADNHTSSDPVRFGVISEIFKAKPELKAGSATYGWVYHTFESIDVLNDEAYLQSIKAPVLMQISGKEKLVDKGAEERAAGLIPNCRRVDMPEARHEIWMEADALRNKWLESVDTFLQERLTGAAPSPKKPEARKPPRPPRLG